MFVHTVCLKWVDNASVEEVAHVAHGLRGLPAQVPSIRGFRFGPDAGLAEGNHDFVVVATFDDADGYLIYADHPAHQAVIVERICPILAGRAAVQFEDGTT